MLQVEKKLSAIILVGCLLILILLVLAPPLDWSTRPKLLTVTTLDVGQGDSIFIRTPDGITLLIDGGADNQVLQRLADVIPWWQRKIDYLVLTHSDHDHYGGLESVVQKYQIAEFWYNGDQSNQAASYQSLLTSLRKRQIPLRVIRQGDEWRWPSRVQLYWLWPLSIEDGERNSGSLVSRLSWGTEDVLLTGDLPSEQEQMILDSGQTMEAEILKVGHHGSKNSSSNNFLSQVQPDLCLISAGQDNSYGHPHPETLKRLQDVSCQIISTIDSGSMTIELGTSTWHWYPASDLPRSAFLGILKTLN